MASSHADRSEQIWHLFNEVAELSPEDRAVRLDKVRRLDPDLHGEVASLLDAHARADAVLDTYEQTLKPLSMANDASGEASQPDPHQLIGRTVSHYRIQAYLGGGGMGVVYKAEDTLLRRSVALKFLPPELTRNTEATARFQREARAAAALEHTNICTVYEIGRTEDSQAFIAMAFYPGDTLKAKIDRGALPMDEALAYAVQMAEGLKCAHSAGIVHRDIKPANVLVTGRGRVKILDFGLAKVARQTLMTQDGKTLGTVSYMSPEQSRGEPVDARTDVWSLGVVLYEMLAGERPFRGDHDQAVLFSILNETPASLSVYRPEVPEALVALVDSALSKKPSDRPASMDEMAEVLKSLHRPTRSAAPLPAARWRRVGVALLILAVLTGISYLLLKKSMGSAVLRLGQTTRVTRAAGLELHPALSPDGRMLAYVAGPEGQKRLFVRQVAGGRPVALTAGFPGQHQWPRWSPDGNSIAFQTRGAIYVVPALGGNPRRLVEGGNLAWSPDGRQIAYTVGGVIYMRAADVGEPRALVESVREPHSLAWSPDGSRLAYVSGNRSSVLGVPSNIEPSSLWVVPVAGDEPVRVTEREHTDLSPVWMPDGRHLLYVSDRDGSRDLHQIALSDTGDPLGLPERLTTGLEAHTISLSPDGTRLAYAVLTIRQNIWSIPIPDDGHVSVTEAEDVTTGSQTIEGIDVSPDGKWLVFDSNRTGNQDIFKMPIAGGEPEQLTTHPAEDFAPTWSPDGREIAFYSLRNGNRDIFVMSAEGGAPQQLTDDPTQETHPDWSPDGQQIVFDASKTGSSQLYIVSRDTLTPEWGTPVQLTPDEEGAAILPRWSPDGELIAFIRGAGGIQSNIGIIAPDGGAPRELIHEQDSATLPMPGFAVWSPDGQTIYYKAYDAERLSSIWSVSVRGGSPRLLVRFDDPTRSSRRDFTTDGERLFFTITEQESDLWVMDVVGEK